MRWRIDYYWLTPLSVRNLSNSSIPCQFSEFKTSGNRQLSGSDVERDARRKQRADATARVLSAPAPNTTVLKVLLCLPTAPALPPEENGDFGKSPIYGQLSDKPLLAFANRHGVPDVKHNRDREIKRRAPSCRPEGPGPPCRFGLPLPLRVLFHEHRRSKRQAQLYGR